MFWKIVIVVLGTIIVMLVATSLWINRGGQPGVITATDFLALRNMTLRSPYWWLMNAAIMLAAGWLLWHWLGRTKA